jgi:hypothetical protein
MKLSLALPAGLLAISLLSVSADRAAALAPRAIADTPAPDPGPAPALAADTEVAGFGPLDPAPPRDGLTPEQIIQKFGERESAFAKARQSYAFRQTVKVDTLAEDTGKVDGEYQQVTDITFSSDGRRDEHVVFAPQNTLERVMMSPADMADIEHRLPFILTTEDLPQYDVKYLGRQKVDELDTYVFSAGPKVLEKGKRYFQGKVWVDQQDLQIVLVNGKNVPDDKRKGHEDLSPPYTTYYEQVDGKYWFPTYTKAEGNLHFSAQDGAVSQDVHIRTVVKYTDYKQFRAKSRIIYNGEELPPAENGTPQAAPANSAPANPTPPKPAPARP